ncbi:barc [Drosophila busckii]|uniref:Barc n=1 Tax=Drosophila busckii TaxID=30019 RepID=A0A0M4EJK0_DROBS|nr:barc [Drosophila busckii]
MSEETESDLQPQADASDALVEAKPATETETETETESASETAGAATSAQQEFADYEQHVSYAADGVAVYTDPSTKQQYKWCSKQNHWLPQTAVKATTTAADPYENEHYKWCAETQQWLPKQTHTTTTETEHYKWDAEQQKWLPKQQQQHQQLPLAAAGEQVVYGVDERGQRTYTDKDGAVFFWDGDKHAWFPNIDENFMARYQMNYGFIDNTSAGEREKAEREAAETKRKEEELKRMTAEAEAAMSADKDAQPAAATGKRKAQEPPKWFDLDPSQNTKVYVTNLPLDITIDEFAELMGKCGMVMRDPQTQKYKLKLYTEADGQIKGDGLCDYIKTL